ncbi:MAG TPA: cation diffusion facilitator family transporter [Thermoanaerobaculia bacterium]|jgi:cobalt-zinc-cadmium efflux system protein|nr:cation diffusion facilitator family transporter [Thermoanaerobaculia bacterium]
MSHEHHHRIEVSQKLVAATVFTFVFVVVEIIAGTRAHSLALISDALHNFTDAVALIIALVAVRLERRPATDEKSFGYQRAGILAAFINAGTLVALTAYIVIEAIQRFEKPEPVASSAMLVVAVAALVLNLAITLALRHEGERDVNIRSAVVHMLGDAISSLGIIGAAILIRVTASPRWDPAISIVIGALILWSSWGILRETVNLLLEGTPSGIDPIDVSRALSEVEGIQGVHHLHIWALGPSKPALSCHLMVGDVPLRSTAAMLDQLRAMLHLRYGIVHATVQFEFAQCADGDLYCLPYERGADVTVSRDT